MKQLKYTTALGNIISTVKLPYGKQYETMVFDTKGREVFCRRHNTKNDAIKCHSITIKYTP